LTREVVAVATDIRDRIEFWREEVLRRASQALQGRLVGLWQATDSSIALIAVGLGLTLPATAAAEINRAIRSWGLPVPNGSRWLAARLDMGRWCIAPVRADIPAPPPHGIERRRKERMALELAGLCLGLIEEKFARDAAGRV
jgi:hypothetical protein